MRLQESGEMYLETIYVLTKKKGFVRSIDVCEEMGYSKPSVSRAVGLLKGDGYLTVDAGGSLHLTEKGRAVAEKTYERHTILTALFVHMGVEKTTAAEDACKIEHVISDETFRAVKKICGRHVSPHFGRAGLTLRQAENVSLRGISAKRDVFAGRFFAALAILGKMWYTWKELKVAKRREPRGLPSACRPNAAG